ncbi:MAG: hypothetical protein HOO06_09145 [Bdellovibrionaceae bacterium]|nr:hypothetical protein [Pseudobdellovibrionaceae bacterium]
MKTGDGGGHVPIQRHIKLHDTRSYQEKMASQKKQLRGAAQMYEKQFLGEMVRAMRKTIDGQHGIVKKSYSEKLYSDQLDSEYVDSWTKSGGVGMADLIFNQITDKYFSGNHLVRKQKGPISLDKNSKSQMHELKSVDEGNGSKTFLIKPEQQNVKPDVTSPWKGKVEKSYKTDQGTNVLELKHLESGLMSKMVFPGSLLQLKPGVELDAGQKIGQFDPGLGVMAWNLRKI